MCIIFRKILNSDQGDLQSLEKKCYVLEEILGFISGSLPEDQRGFTCMLLLIVIVLLANIIDIQFELHVPILAIHTTYTFGQIGLFFNLSCYERRINHFYNVTAYVILQMYEFFHLIPSLLQSLSKNTA